MRVDRASNKDGDFRNWHEPDQPGRPGDVRWSAQTGSNRRTVKTWLLRLSDL